MASKRSAICENGKSYLINPNLLFGQGFDDNIFVSSEDLNIYVELTTSKKNRSIIDVTSNDNVEYTSSDVGKKRVSFIDGSSSGVEKDGKTPKTSLTTSYTELTTVFNKTADTEKFGISSIDIDFNSAYAPLVHIEFVDIRGASLFNTGNPPNSEYSGFFDLPYPIFQLKVKGYYGKTVKYCLHLTKWNARFNTTTGNFEISADFIGYTYAMLSDMLLGYLRAITYTPRGAALFLEAKKEMKNEDELITIKELLDKFVDVNESITKLQDSDDNVIALSKNKELLTSIESMELLLKDGINNIKSADLSQPEYVMFDSGDGLFGVRYSSEDEAQHFIDFTELNIWKDAMKVQLSELNEILSLDSQFNIDDFAGDEAPKYKKKFRYSTIVTGTTETNIEQQNFRNEWKLNDEKDWTNFIDTRISTLKREDRGKRMTIYDFSRTIKKINEIKLKIQTDEKLIKENVGLKIKETFINILGFEPTIGTIFRIFTTHAEIFLACLKEVSEKAENDVNGLRSIELLGLRKDLDVHPTTTIYPWPLFRTPSKDERKGNNLEESYLGDTENGGVKIPQNVPELVFVDELLDALIKVARDDVERQERIENPNIIIDSWYPVNVLDTPLFGVIENPYKTKAIGDLNDIDPLKLMLMRAFTFLGISNRSLSQVEIQLMGILEANTCKEGIANKIHKLAMIDITSSDTVNAETIIQNFVTGTKGGRNVTLNFGDDKKPSGSPAPLFSLGVGVSNYRYLPKINPNDSNLSNQLITFNGDFDGSEFLDSNGNRLSNNEVLNKSATRKEDGVLFIQPEPRDRNFETGSMFMKIFKENDYNKTKNLKPNYLEQLDSIKETVANLKSTEPPFLSVSELHNTERESEDTPLGFNIFGTDGSEFAFTTIKYVDVSTIESGNDFSVGEKAIPNTPTGEINTMPLKALFYVSQPNGYGSTSLATNLKFKPELDKPPHEGNSPQTSNLDYYDVRYRDGARTLIDPDSLTSYPDTVYTDIGKNRELFNNNNVYIPHVDFAVTNRKWYNDVTVYSLFGSQLYFEQRRSSSPVAARALLFLHTFPWNQLFTDDIDLFSFDNKDGGIFDNAEGATISNLFDRKSAFLNVPYLWCAFIGGLLWRYNTSDIIYTNNTDQIPSYKGGSGSFDPIIWGEMVNNTNPNSNFLAGESFLTDFNYAHSQQLPKEFYPKRDEYLTSYDASTSMCFDTDGKYKGIEEVLLNLPIQIKQEFKRLFFDFVESNEWKSIRNNYEIHPQSWDLPNNTNGTYNNNGSNTFNWSNGTNSWKNKWDIAAQINVSERVTQATDGLEYTTTPKTINGVEVSFGIVGIKTTVLDELNINNYEYIQPIRRFGTSSLYAETNYKYIDINYNWDMSFRNNEANDTLVELFKRGVWIANSSYKPWISPNTENQSVLGNMGIITVNTQQLKVYLEAFCNEWKNIIKADTDKKENDELKQQLFNTMDNNTIRLNIYRHCKAIYDKWVAGSQGDVMTSCGQENNSKAKSLALFKRNTSKPRLIDSFRFVNRGFNDLSDTYLLNPSAINEIMTGNLNQSFYDLISRVLADNNFNFIALPAFIDFNSKTEMEALFKPEIINDELNDNVSGPTFVCVYVGQSSNKLDLGNGSDFPNDGFDFKCAVDEETGQETSQLIASGDGTLPADFSKQKKDYEHNVIAFAVNYGQQNQNIFTDIKLDQQEFAETDESLQITDSIANNGSQSNRTQAGQNLWNVYQVRSYSAEVTAMGNAMIQPMMYFQLNNIPMFHGGYLIISAKHKIEPNFMTTTFKGVRTRYVDTPQVDAESLYMSMLGTLSDVDDPNGYTLGNVGSSGVSSGSGSGSGRPKGSVPPIVRTIIENGGSNGKITEGTGNIFLKHIPKIDGIWNLKLESDSENVLLFNAVDPLVEMLTDWVTWMKENEFNGNSNGYAYITSVFRDYDKQVEVKKQYKGSAAEPGTSNHGWGIAIDLQFLKKDGTVITNTANTIKAFDIDYNPAIKWLYDNSYRYGFILPYGLRDKAGLEEHWHFEYHGTAAKCLLVEHPTIYGYTVDVSKNQQSSVTNPKDKDGIRAIYENCKYESLPTGDGTEGGCPKLNSTKPFKKQNGFKSTIDKIINGTYSCNSDRDCTGSFAGLKQVPALWANNKLTKRGILGLAFGVTEGFGSGPGCKNPGNIRGAGCNNGFKKYNTWKEGWEGFNDDVLTKWVNGKVPPTKSATYVECYSDETNNIFEESGVDFKVLDDYNYTPKSNPTLRQFINIYAPWGDNNNPSNYIAGVAKTLKDYGYNINVDDPMSTWL